MKIHESEGVRTFRRDVRSVNIAKAIHALFDREIAPRRFIKESLYLSDVLQGLNWGGPDDLSSAAAYQAVQRSMPFEIAGLVYRVESEGQTRVYQKSKRIVVSPGRLEDYAPARPKKATTIDKRIDARLQELEGWTNVFALREEARRYMDARLEAIEERLQKLEKESVS